MTLSPANGAMSSQLRSMLRYQLSPPRKPVRGEFAGVEVDIRLGQPGRQRRRVDRSGSESRPRAGPCPARGAGRRSAAAERRPIRNRAAGGSSRAGRARTRPRRRRAPGNRAGRTATASVCGIAVVGRTRPRGRNGTLKPATPRKPIRPQKRARARRPARPSRARRSTALSSPSASRRPTMSPTRWRSVYFSISSGRSVSP